MKHKFFLILIVIQLLVAFLFGDNSVAFDVDVSGNVNSAGVQHDTSLSVSFKNLLLNETMFLYWEAENSADDIMLAEMPPGGDAQITTYPNHQFYALRGDQKTKAFPGSIVIDPNELSYSFSAGNLPSAEAIGKMHPKVKFMNQLSKSIGARYKCLAPAVDIWYDDGGDGSYQGTLSLGQETTTNTYIGHVFYFTEKGNKSNELARYVMRKEQILYVVEDKNHPPPKELRDLVDREIAYMEEHKNRTGIPWRHYYGPNGPRPPPKLHMWSAPDIGFRHHVTSKEGFWSCNGNAEKCQDKDTHDFYLQVVSQEPKVFVIENFFTDYEADTITQLAKDKLKISLVGNQEAGGARTSATRTSRNAWLAREESPVLDTLFRRAGDLLNIDQSLLRPQKNAEMLQVVRYENQQKYDSHHDWGVRGAPESRFLTLLLYLNDQEHDNAGGETSFPLAWNGTGIKVHPGKGNAVLFYNLLEDGNADELSLHSGTPILVGTKWVANFWVWDPKKF